MHEEPAPADRGHHHRRLRDRREPARSSTSAASTTTQADILDAALAEARDAGFLGETSSARHSLDLVVHRGAGAYICGEETGAARLARGQARQPAAQAAVPRRPGPYQGPTLINNVETLMNVPHHPADGRRGVRADRHRDLDRHEGRLGLAATSSARATTRSSSACPSREIIYDLAGGPPEGRNDQVLVPRRLVARRCSRHRRDLDLPYDFDSMAKAGSMLGSGAIIVVDDSISDRRRRAEDARSSTATSRAASARRAARARTGP